MLVSIEGLKFICSILMIYKSNSKPNEFFVELNLILIRIQNHISKSDKLDDDEYFNLNYQANRTFTQVQGPKATLNKLSVNPDLIDTGDLAVEIGINFERTSNNEIKKDAPILPKSTSQTFDFLSWSEVEIARQITLCTQYLYNSITEYELANFSWLNVELRPSGSVERFPNLIKFLNRGNLLISFFTEEILSHSNLETRSKAIEKLIKVATVLKDFRNFNDLFVIMVCLNSLPIINLKSTLCRISFSLRKNMILLKKMCNDVETDYCYFRQEYNSSEPCIPMVSLMLKDINLLKKKLYIPEHDDISVNVLRKINEILVIFNKFKFREYSFKPVFKLAFLYKPTFIQDSILNSLSISLETNPENSSLLLRQPYICRQDYNGLNDLFNVILKKANKKFDSKSIKDIVNSYFMPDSEIKLAKRKNSG